MHIQDRYLAGREIVPSSARSRIANVTLDTTDYVLAVCFYKKEFARPLRFLTKQTADFGLSPRIEVEFRLLQNQMRAFRHHCQLHQNR